MIVLISGANSKNEGIFTRLISDILSENIITKVKTSSKDIAAIDWCQANSINYDLIDADFDENGNNAVYVQNAELIQDADIALVIRKSESDRTKTDLLKKATKAQLEIFRNV